MQEVKPILTSVHPNPLESPPSPSNGVEIGPLIYGNGISVSSTPLTASKRPIQVSFYFIQNLKKKVSSRKFCLLIELCGV